MEMLMVEIELTKEEMEAFNSLIEQGCYDQKKYLKRLIVSAINYKLRKDNKPLIKTQPSLG